MKNSQEGLKRETLYTELKTCCRIKGITSHDTAQWFSGKRNNVILFSYSVYIIVTQDAIPRNLKSSTWEKILKINNWVSNITECWLPIISLCRIVYGFHFSADSVIAIRCIHKTYNTWWPAFLVYKRNMKEKRNQKPWTGEKYKP